MLVLADCGDKPCVAIPQNPITPTRIYKESMQGKDVAQYAYAPVESDCPGPKDFSIPITSRRGCDMDEMYQEQQRVKKARETLSKDTQQRYKSYKKLLERS